MESGRRNFIMGYDPLGWNIMGYDPLGWGGDTHGIWKKKFYHGIRPFRVGGGTLMESGRKNFIMGYDPLGWGGVIHGIRKRKLYHGTREGVPLGVPQYREARGGERGWQGARGYTRGGREGGERGWRWATRREPEGQRK